MKKFALKSVATVVGVGLSGVAAAQVDLDDSKSAAYKYASETSVSSEGTSVSHASNLQAKMKVGVGVNKDSTAYIRFDLSNAKFGSTNPTLTCATATVSTAVTGGTTNLAVFGISKASAIDSTEVCTLTTTALTVTSQDAVTIQGRVFETLTNALNPTSSNALNSKTSTFVSWTPAVTIALSSGDKATAIVSESYKLFTGKATAPTLGNVKITETGALLTTGTAAKFTDIVASSSTSVAGDFSFVKDKTATSLGGVTADTVAAAGPATFKSALATGTNSLVVTAEGVKAIPAGSYTATVTLTAKTGFTIANPAAASVGTIVRDGNQLLIPLAQNSTALGGYISRFSLVNRGSADAAYTVSIIQEDGGTATIASGAASGTVKANSTKVVDLTGSVNNFNGRGALLVTVEAASNTISGTYQITNKTSGAVSNQTMLTVSN
jgi:hypothetical protein